MNTNERAFFYSVLSWQKRPGRRSVNVVRTLGLALLLCLTTLTIAAHNSIPLEHESYPIHLRLKFDKYPSTSDSNSYLWERRVLSDLYRDSSWAEESTATDRTWRPVDELPRRVKVGLALAGGGIRGTAHVGVLRALEENNIPIHGIAGTSMGAVVGGLYACGHSIEDLESFMKRDIDWENILGDEPSRQSLPMWVRLREKPREPGIDLNATGDWWPPFSYVQEFGITVGQKLTDEIAERSLEADYRAGFKFDSLSVPFGAILTNLNTGKSELMVEGTISTATRASVSSPIYFEPTIIRGVPYADGAILDDLPVDAFIPFDTSRVPDKLMNTADEDEILYVIGVYPSKRRDVRETVQEPELAGPLGFGVMARTRSLARDYHLWNSWDAAHGKIDMEIEGWLDFSPQSLTNMIHAGYDGAWREIPRIKREIATLEDSLRPSKQIRPISRLSSVKLFSIVEDDTTLVKGSGKRDAILKALRLKQGSYLEKIDICDAMKRIYGLGLYEDVQAKISNVDSDWTVTFFLKRKEKYRGSLKVILKGVPGSACDSVVEEVSTKRERVLNFSEVKELVERSFVEQGFVSPRVDSVRLRPSKRSPDTIYVHVHKGIPIRGVKIVCDDTTDTRTKQALEREFSGPFSPRQVLDKAAHVHREFQLKTIAVEGLEEDTLVIAVKKKTTHTLEFPALSLEMYEGFNFFCELRNRRIRKLSDWALYANYTQNFPLKVAQELPRGQRLGAGRQRCRSLLPIPDVNVHWMSLRFPSQPDTSHYDKKFDEICGQLSLPVYFESFAFIPAVEVAGVATYMMHQPKEWQGQVTGVSWLRYDNLDRMVFPESGWKADIDAKVDLKNNSWSRARMRMVGVPFRWRIQNKITTTLALRSFGSWYSDDTPCHERYSLGGITPTGSYQLTRHDSEDLPGHTKYEFIEPLMWKVGGSARLAFIERSLLGIRANAHLEGSLYIADAVPQGKSLFSADRIRVCPTAGAYLDTSFGNFGLALKGTRGNIWHHLYLSVVLYGLGL